MAAPKKRNPLVFLLLNISLLDPETVQHLQATTQNFLAKGFPLEQAQRQTYAVFEGILMKQVSLIAYAQVFTALGLFFLACLPLILLIKRVKVAGRMSLDAYCVSCFLFLVSCFLFLVQGFASEDEEDEFKKLASNQTI